jgi:2-polyprenyl-3-methyl-5-hydroxy-6-metoxy-1,4-benzoquinol methylase
VDLDQLQQNWDRFGQIDPLWAILSSPDKINSNWNRAEFFQTGVDEINRVMQYVDSLGISVSMKRAVDFGCGVGRLTQALCRYFDECRGIDIAPSMIDLARKYNQFGDRCVYHFNQTDALPDFETSGWDFVLSDSCRTARCTGRNYGATRYRFSRLDQTSDFLAGGGSFLPY